MTRYLLYLVRWQFCAPVLALVIWLVHLPTLRQTVVANPIGGLIFFRVDRFMFRSRSVERFEQWETRIGACHHCGSYGALQRPIRAPGYDKRDDRVPQYRCPACLARKAEEVEGRGIASRPSNVVQLSFAYSREGEGLPAPSTAKARWETDSE
jgi:hypothetical protein